jgi:hypothetical protein
MAAPCDAAGKQSDVGDEGEGGRGSDGFLPVLGQPAASAEPRESRLHDPSAGQSLEALGLVGTLDDPEGPSPFVSERGLKLVSGKAAVGADVAQPGAALRWAEMELIAQA